MKQFFRVFADVPRQVLTASAVILVCALAWGILYNFLGDALAAAEALNGRLTREIEQTRRDTTQARTDHEFVVENQARYEALLKSDRLIPHTRRAAMVELQNVQRRRGPVSLNFSFEAAGAGTLTSAIAQPASGNYKLSVEMLTLRVASPTDTAIYGIMSDITDYFPGSAVIERVTLRRAPVITSEALDAISRGENSRLVEGDLIVSWRTAQEEKKADAAK